MGTNQLWDDVLLNGEEDDSDDEHGDDAHGDDAHGDDAHGDDANGDNAHGDDDGHEHKPTNRLWCFGLVVRSTCCMQIQLLASKVSFRENILAP